MAKEPGEIRDLTLEERLEDLESKMAALRKLIEAVRVTCSNNASRLDTHYDRLEEIDRRNR